MSIELGGLLTAMAQLVVIGGGFAGVYWAVKRWVADIGKNTRETAKQLETSNGHTIGQYIEASAAKLDELAQYGKENRTLIQHVSDRLDAHLKGHV